MTPDDRRLGLRALGHDLAGRDLEVYAQHHRDPDEPILGEGPADARVALFGRDPGRDEVRMGIPFVGAGGQKLRAGLHRAVFGGDPLDADAAMKVQPFFFWANTVPYKPLGNKAWSTKIIRAFRPYIADLLLTAWSGTDVICLGQGSFDWFGLDAPKAVRQALDAHWEREDRYTSSVEVPLTASGVTRTVRLHPLPHPSPLNATWLPRFPGLLDARMRDLRVTRESWRTG